MNETKLKVQVMVETLALLLNEKNGWSFTMGDCDNPISQDDIRRVASIIIDKLNLEELYADHIEMEKMRNLFRMGDDDIWVPGTTLADTFKKLLKPKSMERYSMVNTRESHASMQQNNAGDWVKYTDTQPNL